MARAFDPKLNYSATEPCPPTSRMHFSSVLPPAERQKVIYEEQSQAQGSSKRNRIDFAPSSSKQPRSGYERDAPTGPKAGLSYGVKNDGGRESKKSRWR
jgi:hypothetical protein